jgi:hypothetical protein
MVDYGWKLKEFCGCLYEGGINNGNKRSETDDV